MERSVTDKLRSYDPFVFWISAIITVLFVVWAAVFPDNMNRVINGVFNWTTGYWGWLYLLTVFLLVVSCFILLGRRFGTMKLGLPGDNPEFKTFTWFAMLFGSAIAAGIVFWGPAEPAYHYMTPPPYFGGAAKTAEAGANAMTTSFFHWGLSAWAIYVMLTIPLAHACYTKNLPFKFSSAFYYVLGKRIFGRIGKVLDIFAVFATLGGLATTTGLVALQLSSGLKAQYSFEIGTWGTFIIIAALTGIFTLAVATGLKRGIKWIGHLIPMSLFTAPSDTTNWLGGWTVFYWAWWMSWAPFVSVFIARISKGRTIRQTVAATLIFPTLANMLWYTVVGGAGISFDVTETLSTEGLESAIFAIANNLPITGIISIILIILIVTFFLTSANSAALSLSMFTSGSEEPTKRLRIFWGISLGAVAAVLAGTGGLKAIQTASIATAFPLMFLLLLVIYGTFRGLSLYRKENPDLTANKEQA
ncbi:MAG: BCCT family transporter [bacterium]